MSSIYIENNRIGLAVTTLNTEGTEHSGPSTSESGEQENTFDSNAGSKSVFWAAAFLVAGKLSYERAVAVQKHHAFRRFAENKQQKIHKMPESSYLYNYLIIYLGD